MAHAGNPVVLCWDTLTTFNEPSIKIRTTYFFFSMSTPWRRVSSHIMSFSLWTPHAFRVSQQRCQVEQMEIQWRRKRKSWPLKNRCPRNGISVLERSLLKGSHRYKNIIWESARSLPDQLATRYSKTCPVNQCKLQVAYWCVLYRDMKSSRCSGQCLGQR